MEIFKLLSHGVKMLTGELPFQGEYEQAVMYMVLNEEPAPVSSLCSGVPQELAAAIHKTLAKNANERYQQMDELLPEITQLQKSLEQQEDSGSVSTTGFRKPAGMRRSRWLPLWLVGVSIVALIALATVVSYFIPDRSGTPETPATIKQLTSFRGNTYAPSWNPDGSMFAYGHTADGPMNIYVMTPGGAPHQLTDTPSDELAPRWSLTGDKIAFTSDRGNGVEIFWIAPTSGREHRLTNTFIPPPERQSPWFRGLGISPWSSEGKELLFHRMLENGAIAIWKINIVSRHEVQLTFPEPETSDMSASWSPDGKWIAFDRNQKGSSAIWLMSAQGGQARPYIEDEYFNFAPAWVPDGSKMLFLSMRQPFIINIWEYDWGSETLRPLTNQTSGIFAYSISTKGDIAYSASGHQTDLYLGKVGEPINSHQNLTHNTLNNLGARFSPDGKTIVYHSDRNGNYDIWMYSRETDEHLQLTDHPGIDVVPDWSSKGDILFVSNRGGKFQLWVIDEANNSPRLLNDVEIPLHQELPVITRNGPRWSPDASMIGYIAAGDSSETLLLIDVSSGKTRKTYLEGALSFDWYLDSDRVIYVKKTSKSSMKKELRAANLRTGEDILLLAGA
ncbi:MAG: hypothetical protein ACE5I1_22160, partial [bacterium]